MLDLVRFVARHRLILAGGAMIGLAAGLSAALLMTKVYRAEVKMLPAENRNVDTGNGMLEQLGGLAGLAGLTLNAGSSAKSAALEVLRSRALAREFIMEKSLTDVILGPPGFFHGKSTAAADQARRLDAAIRRFDEKIRNVSEDRRTGIITLSIDWSNPQTAASWANDLVASLNRNMRARAREEAQRSLQYLDQQLQRTTAVEVRQAIYGLMEHELKSAMFAEVSEEYALRVVDAAMVPDRRRYVEPKPFLFAFGALAFGVLVAATIAVWRDVRVPVTK